MERSVAIVGLGPRGLCALESLATELNRTGSTDQWVLTLFDDSGYPGSGPNYAPDQLALNRLNIPCREVPLPSRPPSSGVVDIPAFPGYLEWQSEFPVVDEQGFDVYPSRASIGHYLQARFRSWLQAWQATWNAELVMATAVHIESAAQKITIEDSVGRQHGDFTDVLLALGHQPVVQDESLTAWRRFVDNAQHCLLVEHPYPTEQFVNCDQYGQRRCAIRGMGLGMIDTVKALTQGRGGSFRVSDAGKGRYQYCPSGREPDQIIPFSLDGLPMVPKPANKTIDSNYSLDDKELNAFTTVLAAHQQIDDGVVLRDAIIDGVATIASAIYLRLEDRCQIRGLDVDDLVVVIRRWLHDESFRHAGIVSHDLSTDQAMRQFLLMAIDQAPISIDYCVGQVWRHCHRSMYRELAFASVGSELLVPIIELDQRIKRYAFGPPVDSVSRMLALVDGGIMSFCVSEDPVIRPDDKQWTLSDKGERRSVDVMIDSVQAPPDLTQVATPLVRSLQDAHILIPVSVSLGAMTRSDGGVPVARRSKNKPSIALVGRLATGSIIEADALMECFGPALQDWAASIVPG